MSSQDKTPMTFKIMKRHVNVPVDKEESSSSQPQVTEVLSEAQEKREERYQMVCPSFVHS